MQETIEVRKGDGTVSQIIVGDVLGRLEEFAAGRRVVIITDSNVHRRYQKVINAYEYILIGIGETHKTLITIDNIYNQLIELNVDREAMVVGFGGGIVTDIAGFVAATYMRGLRFGFVATTLLAQIDASVGGKNGVNVNGYKNMVGTFTQPDFVLCDTTILKTLPEREFKAGMAEVIKSAIIADRDLFEMLEKSSYEELSQDQDLLRTVIASTVKVKASIVGRDERESGERRKLNLGHTFAHAIEKSVTTHIHGEAVAIGTVTISALAVKLGVLSVADNDRILALFAQYGLPTTTNVEIRRLLRAIKLDKKRDQNEVNIVLPVAIGECIVKKMSFDEIEKLIS